MSAPAASALAGIDLTDLDNFASGFPHELFEIHRREAPVWWHEPTEHTPDGEGFWSVATHAATMQVLRESAKYSSETGGERPYGGTLIQDLPIAGRVLNMMDDPRHARIRRLAGAGLTPRTVLRLEQELRVRMRRLLADADTTGEIDFLTDIAAELPMQMICILLGVPETERHWLFEAVEPGFDYRGSRKSFESDGSGDAMRQRMAEYGAELIAQKRAVPGDDLLSVAVHATLDDADPPVLTDAELYSFFSLLFTAGSETTRNAMAGGLAALLAHPDQLELLRGDLSLLPTAIEEMLRWTTPSPSKRRTATTRTELGGHTIEPGQKVVFWEGSANRDELVFSDSMTFDITRDPNPHIGFGHGIHFCLGANLARLEMRVLFEELLPRFDGFELTRPIEWTRSNRHTGIRHLYVQMQRLSA
jgi:cytochrome P450